MSDKSLFDDPHVKQPSERSFGLLFAGVSFLGGCYVIYKSLPMILAAIFFLAAIAFLLLAAFFQHLLRPLSRAWFAFGLLLGKVVSPVVLGVIFFLVITPFALVMRLAGRDALRVRKHGARSYWIDRVPAGPPSHSFKNQF